jgi:hypothetical protein
MKCLGFHVVVGFIKIFIEPTEVLGNESPTNFDKFIIESIFSRGFVVS